MHILVGLYILQVHLDLHCLLPRDPVALTTLTLSEGQRQNPHPDQVTPMDPLEGLGYHSFDSLEVRALGSPVSA